MEIEAAIEEEREARKNLGLKEAFLGKGNWIRFAIAFWIFFLQQWGGQNSVNYYTPLIFSSVCIACLHILQSRSLGCVLRSESLARRMGCSHLVFTVS